MFLNDVLHVVISVISGAFIEVASPLSVQELHKMVVELGWFILHEE